MIAACLETKCLELLYQPLAMHLYRVLKQSGNTGAAQGALISTPLPPGAHLKRCGPVVLSPEQSMFRYLFCL